MAKIDRQVKVLNWYAINKNSEARGLHTVYNLTYLPVLESEVLKYPSKEAPFHPIKSLLHVQLDHHKALLGGDTLKVMHEFLYK